MADQKPLPLAAKLAAIMAEVEAVPKRGHNEHFGYDFATEADIAGAIRKGMAARKVFLLPSVTSYADQTIITKGDRGEKSKTITTIKMAFTFLDGESGDCQTCEWAGRGEDSSDKGLYKAMTGAVKFFLMKAFLIPTGDDPEIDKREKKGQRRREVNEVNGDRVDTGSGEVKGQFITGKQQRELIEAGQKAGWKGEDFATWLKKSGYEQWSRIPSSAFATTLAIMNGGSEASHAA